MEEEKKERTSFYAIHVGRRPGVYQDYEEAKEQVQGHPGAVWKRFSNREEAQAFVLHGKQPHATPQLPSTLTLSTPQLPSTPSSSKEQTVHLYAQWDVQKALEQYPIWIWFGPGDPRNYRGPCSLVGKKKEEINGQRLILGAAIMAINRFFQAQQSLQSGLFEGHLIVFTESRYLDDGFNRWLVNWKKTQWKGETVKNRDLWKILARQVHRQNIAIVRKPGLKSLVQSFNWE